MTNWARTARSRLGMRPTVPKWRNHLGLRRERPVPRYIPQPRRARLRMTGESLPVDSHQAECGCVAQGPFEVVQPRPVEIAAHIDALGKAGLHLAQRGLHVSDAPLVVGGGDPALGDENRQSWTALRRPADRSAKRLGVVLVPHLGRGLGLGHLALQVAPVVARAARAFGPDPESCVSLDADELVLLSELQEP